MTRYATDELGEIITAVYFELGKELEAAGDLNDPQNYDELTEGINTDKTFQVYWEAIETVDSDSGATQKLTLGDSDGPVIQETIIIHADYYATQRSNIGDDMVKLIDGVQAIRAKIKAQPCTQPFGIVNCKSFQWRADRVTFEYGQDVISYVGARFILRLRLF